jgi:hypothetical protein
VGCGNTIYFTIKYDVKAIIPFLMTFFHQSNPTIEECKVGEPIEQLEDDINIFGVATFMEEFS